MFIGMSLRLLGRKGSDDTQDISSGEAGSHERSLLSMESCHRFFQRPIIIDLGCFLDIP